jgi:hypothetical protein
MRELDDLIELRRKITATQERIRELTLQITSPKNQIISDMPKGDGGSNGIEDYIIKKEKFIVRLKGLQFRANTVWNVAECKFKNSNLSTDEIYLMKLHFYYGLIWKTCAIEMQKCYSDTKWNENRVYRTYRSILAKINKNYCAVC